MFYHNSRSTAMLFTVLYLTIEIPEKNPGWDLLPGMYPIELEASFFFWEVEYPDVRYVSIGPDFPIGQSWTSHSSYG